MKDFLIALLTGKRSFAIIYVNSRLLRRGYLMSDTKERILQTALRLFAANGYEAVSVSAIAGELGMTKGALYKHYKNKRDIFDSIVTRMEQRDAERAKDFELPEGTLAEMEDEYCNASINQMVEYSKSQFRYWTEDEFASAFRRMLTLEQYRNEEMGQLYQQYLASGPLGYVSDLFNSLELPQPQKKAVDFYAPMFLLYTIYDGAEDKKSVLSMVDASLEKLRTDLNQRK